MLASGMLSGEVGELGHGWKHSQWLSEALSVTLCAQVFSTTFRANT